VSCFKVLCSRDSAFGAETSSQRDGTIWSWQTSLEHCRIITFLKLAPFIRHNLLQERGLQFTLHNWKYVPIKLQLKGSV